jgi:beta-fructofuranosidase
MYAPNLTRHPDGRCILFGWIHELGSEEERVAQGCQGLLTLPREIHIQNGELYTNVAKETQQLRQKQLMSGGSEISQIHFNSGRHLEIELATKLTGGSIDIELLKASDCPGLRLILQEDKITVDKGENGGFEAKIQAKEIMHFHLFIDDSSIEVYINSKEVLTTRYYSTPDNFWMELKVNDSAEILDVQCYELKKAVFST